MATHHYFNYFIFLLILSLFQYSSQQIFITPIGADVGGPTIISRQTFSVQSNDGTPVTITKINIRPGRNINGGSNRLTPFDLMRLADSRMNDFFEAIISRQLQLFQALEQEEERREKENKEKEIEKENENNKEGNNNDNNQNENKNNTIDDKEFELDEENNDNKDKNDNINNNNNITNKNNFEYINNFDLSNKIEIFNIQYPLLPPLENEKNNIYTLVLDLDETLVHFFYTPSGGTFLIRPYCFEFLNKMSKIFEIVIFTAAMKDYADSILDILDLKKNIIKYRLYRQHTSIEGMSFSKDLSKLGRDLNKVIIIDNLSDNFKLQPNNGIHIGTWIDNMKDTELLDIGNFLEDLILRKPNDVRIVIQKIKEDFEIKNNTKNVVCCFKNIDLNKFME